MRGVTSDLLASDQRGYISTRTPHAGSDAVSILENLAEIFQPALPMRGVTRRNESSGHFEVFQPALPMRGVTPSSRRSSKVISNFNPHSPCGE